MVGSRAHALTRCRGILPGTAPPCHATSRKQVLPYFAVRFGLYDILKREHQRQTGGAQPSAAATASFGMLAGLAASALTFPCEVARRRAMVGSAGEHRRLFVTPPAASAVFVTPLAAPAVPLSHHHGRRLCAYHPPFGRRVAPCPRLALFTLTVVRLCIACRWASVGELVWQLWQQQAQPW